MQPFITLSLFENYAELASDDAEVSDFLDDYFTNRDITFSMFRLNDSYALRFERDRWKAIEILSKKDLLLEVFETWKLNN